MTHAAGRRLGAITDTKGEAPHRSEVGDEGSFQIHVQTAIEAALALSVHPPRTSPVRFDRQDLAEVVLDSRTASTPLRIQLDGVAQAPQPAVFNTRARAGDDEPASLPAKPADFETVQRFEEEPSARSGRRLEARAI